MPGFGAGMMTLQAVPNTKQPGAQRSFASVPSYFVERNYVLSGLTQDSAGLPLGNVVVKLFNTATDVKIAQTVSSNLGVYSFNVDKTIQHYTVDYKAGPPDVYGTSPNTLMGS